MWTDDLARLKKIYLGYLAAWLGGGALLILGMSSGAESGGGLAASGVVLLGIALICYIACLVFAYRVQKGMKADGLTTHDPAHIIIAGIVFAALFIVTLLAVVKIVLSQA